MAILFYFKEADVISNIGNFSIGSQRNLGLSIEAYNYILFFAL